MKLDEVLAIAGEHPLSSYAWGVNAVILVNSLVPADQQIDVNHTGNAAHDKLRRLPSTVLFAILSREVQIEGVSVEFLPTAIESHQGRPPTIPTNRKPMSPAAMMMMVVMTIIALSMTFSTLRAPPDAKPQDFTALLSLVKTMSEFAKTEGGEGNKSDTSPSDAPQP